MLEGVAQWTKCQLSPTMALYPEVKKNRQVALTQQLIFRMKLVPQSLLRWVEGSLDNVWKKIAYPAWVIKISKPV